MARKDCWRTIAVCLVLGFGTIALYFPVFHFGFVNFDDELYVAANPHVNRGVTASGLEWAFQTSYAGNWHPVTWISHMVDSQVFGANVGGHHATSLVLHALNAMLLFVVLRRMTGFFWRSAVVAALFAWHPLHVEAVSWIADRKDVLSGFFWMLALWGYLRYVENSKAQLASSKVFYVLAVLFFALGLMAKPMLVTLPIILLLIDWWPLGRLRFGAAPEGEPADAATPSVGSVLIEKVPFVLLSAASCVITVMAARWEEVSSPIAQLPFKVRFITAGVSYFRYLEKTVWPSDLGPVYPFAVRWPKWELAGIALALIGMTILSIAVRKSRPYWFVGWLWFVVMLVPALNLILAVARPMADRYMYLPSIGLFILIVWDASEVAAQWPFGRVVLGVLCGLALAGCCVASWYQVQVWRNERTFITRIAEPESNFIGHANYASFLLAHDQLPQAQAECETAITIMPGYSPFYAEMGEILLAEGKLDGAIEQFRLVQKVDPRMIGIHIPWGRALMAQKHVEAAEAEFRIVLDADPKSFEAHKYLGEAFVFSGKKSSAVEEFRASLSLQPNQPELLNNLAWILATDPHPELRNGAAALKLATRACELTRDAQPAYLGTLAAALAEEGRYDEAVKAAQKAHDTAASDAAAAQKSNQPTAARVLQALADRNLQLLAIYKSHQAFHEKLTK